MFKKTNQKGTSKTKSNQESNQKCNQKHTSRTKSNQENIKIMQPKNTSKTQRVVWGGRVGLVLDKGLFWRRVKCRTFGRFFPAPGQKSHFWSIVFFRRRAKVVLFALLVVFVFLFVLFLFCEQTTVDGEQQCDFLPGAEKQIKNHDQKCARTWTLPKLHQKARLSCFIFACIFDQFCFCVCCFYACLCFLAAFCDCFCLHLFCFFSH